MITLRLGWLTQQEHGKFLDNQNYAVRPCLKTKAKTKKTRTKNPEKQKTKNHTCVHVCCHNVSAETVGVSAFLYHVGPKDQTQVPAWQQGPLLC